ncbi:MAG TPA: N-acetylmuramoyl-L-alanine amidase [Gammaproteobacteria bacterium]|nr:N-acetylmuramoyl-L-alanine amidase [Gammaproteobacteria bacterium]
MRVWPAPDNTRVVFDMSGPVKYEIFTIPDPNRVVIDVDQAQVIAPLNKPGGDLRLLKGVRWGERPGGGLRMVLDVAHPVQVRTAMLNPNQQYGHRLLVDLVEQARASDVAPFAGTPLKAQPLTLASAAPSLSPALSATRSVSADNGSRDIVVAVDAGHGGDDPGATGSNGTREKDITLSIARRLAGIINQQKGMRAVLTRNGDYFIPLRERMDKAREQKADLFVSIHADSYRDPRTRGSSVYVLSQRGASSEAARWLADQENASDLVGGVTLDDKDAQLKSVLLDLSQTAAIEASVNVAGKVLTELDDVGNVHHREVQHAGFVVLKSPDIPSILIETAYITNPQEEKKLRSADHQQALAQAIAEGVQHYFEDNPPTGTFMAQLRQSRMTAAR